MSLDLLCCESTSVSFAQKDPALLSDDRVFQNMLKSEVRCLPSADYLTNFQTNISPSQRKTVVDWMWEVCEEQKCQEDIYPLAVNYFDRFLSRHLIHKNSLQLLGTTCLLVSSKLRESDCMNVDLLILYTDSSCTSEELLMWELLLLGVLKWDVSAITAHDFLWYILKRLQVDPPQAFVNIVVKHCCTFIGMCARDYKFSSYLPSVIAGGCIAAALNGLEAEAIQKYNLFAKLSMITGNDQEAFKECQEKIEAMVDAHKSTRQATENQNYKTAETDGDNNTDCWY